MEREEKKKRKEKTTEKTLALLDFDVKTLRTWSMEDFTSTTLCRSWRTIATDRGPTIDAGWDDIAVGEAVVYTTYHLPPRELNATVKYVGRVPALAGTGLEEWIGLEFARPVGDTDGSRGGIRFWTCKPKHATFVRREQLRRRPKLTMLRTRLARGGDGSEPGPTSSASPASTSLLLKLPSIEPVPSTAVGTLTASDLRAQLDRTKRSVLSSTLRSIRIAHAQLSGLDETAAEVTTSVEQQRQVILALARVDDIDLRWRTAEGCKPNLFGLEWRLPAPRRHKKRPHDDLPLAVLLNQCKVMVAQAGASPLEIAKLQLEIGERFHDLHEFKRALMWWRKRAIVTLEALWHAQSRRGGGPARIMPGEEKRGALSQSEEDKFAVITMLRKSHSHAMRLCIGHLVMQGIAALHVAKWLSLSQAVDHMNRTVAARAGQAPPAHQRPRDLGKTPARYQQHPHQMSPSARLLSTSPRVRSSGRCS